MRDPLHRIPERLFGFAKETPEIDQRLKEITARLGVRTSLLMTCFVAKTVVSRGWETPQMT
jgi:hypothetical protein